MEKVRAAKLHLLTVRETQTAGDGDHSDDGGLLLRVRHASASWVFRFTSPAGRRREMGLGPAPRGSSAETGESLTLARKLARDARDRQWISSPENHIPSPLWNKPIAEITAPELLSLAGVRSLEVAGERIPETLRRIRQRLEAVFEDAVFHGHCTTNPTAAVRRKMRENLPVQDLGSFKALDYREVPALMQRLRTAPGIAARALELAV